MLDNKGHVKLTDFGSSIRVNAKGEVRIRCAHAPGPPEDPFRTLHPALTRLPQPCTRP